MVSMGRRDVLGWMTVGAMAPWLSACSTLPSAGGSGGSLDLLYVADTLDARQPGLPVVPATRLGPATRIGQAPWISGQDARAAGSVDASLAGLLDASLAGQVQTGGYPVLGAVLQRLRREAGEGNSLTLENGQCWNGSGLAYLTQGVSGVQGSALLGSEVRVSSDERLLWPEACAGLYRQFAQPVLGAGLEPGLAQRLGTRPVTFFKRGGVRIAVVGITDPYARDQKASLRQWLDALRPAFEQARAEAELVVALADVGTGPGLWLAERVSQVDLLLCARGQDFWPQPVQALQASGKRVPVLFGGSRASGAFRIRCQQAGGQWQFTAQFQPAFEGALGVSEQAEAQRLRQLVHQQRAAHAGWLDQPLARAPEHLWRRDVRGGNWDRLLHQALSDQSERAVLLPGLRYDSPLPRGQMITREHLLSLTGSYPAPVVEVSASQVPQVLENAAEQLFGEPLLLDNSQDLPRWFGHPWEITYSASGQRVSGLGQPAGACRTFGLGFDARAGQPLWQHLEAWLRERPDSWQLAALTPPPMRYVQGHPGWHPREVAG
ncbi:lipoprotein UxpA [Pseudomonas sp. DTU_2021_1001937_2_SI_NGA_ILE_001]|uniref:lipoprotein UxpA n=1 Tax=Pseudomonas sp. DTU_2021_1001937_2_SI_NGA_ILE_001 TaxID=3077589 RepID=UPI0028FC0BD4|nr:lipoprotein UxpA [Pseudomonas sp. DTU_2021_1001937_2_SI_NGA_ILE_001]WNW13206.1 lipoprotein UxpA [Pseudomonas sp. DTU_2021_1001937_2_SI_NGA_ILE_001]